MKYINTIRKTGALAASVVTTASLFAQAPSAATSSESSNSVVSLNAFEVNSDSDSSYGALNSNSVTRFNAELNKMPISADIYDQAFMKDVAATSVESLITGYSAGAGYNSAYQASGASAQPGDHVSHDYLQLRGFDTPSLQRDGLMPLGLFFNPGATAPGLTSNFDVERVEIIEGPQALLYAGGGAGGVVNIVSKQARIGQPTFGEIEFSLDQYGSKLGQVDFGASNDLVAIRVALLDQEQLYRRVNVGGYNNGIYGQVAVRVFGNTTLRLTGEHTVSYQNSASSSAMTMSATTTANDSRSGQNLHYLLATGQTGTVNPVTGAAYGANAGAIDNGMLNWGNVDSFLGSLSNGFGGNTWEALSLETKWNAWLSSQVSVGYDTFKYDLLGVSSPTLLSPLATTNPLGVWAVSGSLTDDNEPARNKAIRASLLADNDLFGGHAHSQTIIGADFVRSDAGSFDYRYFQADSNLNVIVNPASTTNNGRTILPTQIYSAVNGPVEYPLFNPRNGQIIVNGVNYVRQLQNQVNPALISPSNPLGLAAGNSSAYEFLKQFNKGVFAVNNTQWMDGKLDTLAGVRFANVYSQVVEAAVPNNYALANTVNMDVGANYALLSWLRPYFDISTSYDPPAVLFSDPDGNLPKVGRGTGQEAGLKFTNASGTISGTLSYYHTKSTNEEYQLSSALTNDINPTGLNGRAGANLSSYADVERGSQGLQLQLTANPVPNWRMRLTAADVGGKINTTVSYPQLYNDQFYENSAGNVTYADGTLVYVPATFNSKQLTVTSTTAGAVPLTATMLSTPTSSFYANPLNPSGQISSTSNGAKVLGYVDPVHGSILTGVTGLPISAMQVNTALSGFSVPGSVIVAQAGDQTLGYPKYSVNFTNLYTFSSGPARGIEVGGTVSGSWKAGEYYYYPNGVNAAGLQQRTLLTAPVQGRIDLILGYTHRFRRVTWSTQMNINNLLNHYVVQILPDEINGWTSQTNLNAAFIGQPRSYTWTTRVSF